MGRPKSLELIIKRISLFEEGTVFITSDFFDIATLHAVNKALSRLNEKGKIRRVVRGIYEKPQVNRNGDIVDANPNAVAMAIARNHGWTASPCGDTALNLFGFREEAPEIWTFVSNGPYREYEYGEVKIKFKHGANKEIAGLSDITALVVQTIRAIGQKALIESQYITKMRQKLTKDEKQKIAKEANRTTAWIYKIIKQVCEQ